MDKVKYCEKTLKNGRGEVFYCVRVLRSSGIEDFITSNIQEHYRRLAHYESTSAKKVSEI